MNNDHWGAQETETRSELLHHCLHRHSETPAAAADVAERVADRVADRVAECVAERVAVAVHCGADGNTVDVARCRRSVAADLVPNAVAAVDIGYTCLGMLQYIVHFHAAAAAYTSLGAFEQASAAAAHAAKASGRSSTQHMQCRRQLCNCCVLFRPVASAFFCASRRFASNFFWCFKAALICLFATNSYARPAAIILEGILVLPLIIEEGGGSEGRR